MNDDRLRIWYLDRVDYVHDEYISMCVIATNEKEARKLAYQHFHAEPGMEDELHYVDEWLDPEKVVVEKVTEIGKGVVELTLLYG